MSEDVAKWLEALGLGKYVHVFVENDVDLRTLPELTEGDLKELGLSLGHRRALQRAVATFSQDGQEPSNRPATPSPTSAVNSHMASRCPSVATARRIPLTGSSIKPFR